MKVEVKAFAKINLMLDILRGRNDGYHELFMVMQSIGVYDTVTVEKKGRKIELTCDNENIPCDETNIAYKAALAFFKANKIRSRGVHIDIKKRIPHAAGLAGGSADGAAVIVALNVIYNTNLSQEELCDIGVKVGADVPFCIVGGTQLAQGIGEVLTPLKPLKKCYILLAKPDFGVNTGKAYSAFDEFGKQHTPDELGMLIAVQSRDIYAISSKLENVFEQFIEVKNRVSIKEIMRNNNALGVCMSGSGPTIFGIYNNKDNAEKSQNELKGLAKDVIICEPKRFGCKVKVIE